MLELECHVGVGCGSHPETLETPEKALEQTPPLDQEKREGCVRNGCTGCKGSKPRACFAGLPPCLQLLCRCATAEIKEPGV